MKFPQHLVLDYQTKELFYTTKYWAVRFIDANDLNFKAYSVFISKLFLLYTKKNVFFFNKNLKSLTLKKKRYGLLDKYRTLKVNKFFFKKLNLKVKNKALYTQNSFKLINDLVLPSKDKYNVFALSRIIYKFSFNQKNKIQNTRRAHFFFKNLFDINFLRKEKIYTKLKYSRVPQYDIVSGGAAALLAGFLGFLICEKFGFELLDSGDFYFLFMYGVFLSFFIRLFVKLLSFKENNWSLLSLKWFKYYFFSLFNLIKHLSIKL